MLKITLLTDILDDVKQEFLKVQIRVSQGLHDTLLHPKLPKVVLLTSQWWTACKRRKRRNGIEGGREKVRYVTDVCWY